MPMLDPNITILRATPDNLDVARQAVVEINLPTSHHATLDDVALSEFLANPAHYLLVAVEDKRAVGSLYGYALRPPYRREPQFLLYTIDVRPSDWRRGIGTALVDRFIAEARQAAAFEVWVVTNEANRAAMALYQRGGFRRPAVDDVMLIFTSGPDGVSS